jgi:hypothetical protein
VAPRSWSSSSWSRTSSSTPESSLRIGHRLAGDADGTSRRIVGGRGGSRVRPTGFLAWLVVTEDLRFDGRAGHPYLPGAAVAPFQGADRLRCVRPRRAEAPYDVEERRIAGSRRRLVRSARSPAGWFGHRYASWACDGRDEPAVAPPFKGGHTAYQVAGGGEEGRACGRLEGYYRVYSTVWRR